MTKTGYNFRMTRHAAAQWAFVGFWLTIGACFAGMAMATLLQWSAVLIHWASQ